MSNHPIKPNTRVKNVRAFGVAKDGNSADEYEDAFEYEAAFNLKPTTYRFAVADGATESSFSKQWAKLLTEGFVRENSSLTRDLETQDGKDGKVKWLSPLQQKWHKDIQWGKLSWVAEKKAREGAYSTFLGLQIYPKTWLAWAVGDCGLFQVRDDELIAKWPMEQESQFGSTPALLCSLESRNDLVLESHFLFKSGKHKARDLFILATDALAQWFLAQYHAGEKPWSQVDKITNESEFADFLKQLRDRHTIRNDDTTLVIFRARNAWL